jgi:hypothetical protein
MTASSKACKRCGLVSPIGEFEGGRRGVCRSCRNEAARDHYAAHRADVLARQRRARAATSAWLRLRYGMTRADFDRLAASQHHRCAVCAVLGALVVVDHDHVTGRVRGLLCERCNCGLGQLRDSPAICTAAADYLDASGARLVAHPPTR